MILLSIGNLGDLLIQAAFLRAFDRQGVSVAVPESYAGVAGELFPSAEVIALPDESSDGRWLMRRRIDRATGIAWLKADLESRFPRRDVVSIALTDDVIQIRGLNIYEAYARVLGREPRLAPALAAMPSPQDDRAPFTYLPAWREGAAAKTVCIAPWGGIGVKQLDPATLRQIMEECVRLGCTPQIIASPRDDAGAYPFVAAERFRTLSPNRLVHDAAEALASSRLVIAVDTAWYHLAAMVGAPTLGVPGPRSLAHFQYPGRTRGMSLQETRLCVDCYSVDRCVVTARRCCDAQPDAAALVSAVAANLGGSPLNATPTTKALGSPSPIRRRISRAKFRVIDLVRPV